MLPEARHRRPPGAAAGIWYHARGRPDDAATVAPGHDARVADALEQDLRATLSGEVRFDTASRALYSTDASVYQIEPRGVVIPRSRDDVAAAVTIAARHGVPITPRGGGTSQAGQAIGEGLVLDTSKYLNRVLAIDPDARTARVEPGVVLDELNHQLKPHGLRFAPDVSSSSRATVGGMMANNSSGARSVLYGKTIDHVRSQQVVLADGSTATLAPLTAAGAGRRRARRVDPRPGAARRPGPGPHPRRRDRPPLPEGAAPGRRLQPRRLRRRGARRSICRG